MKLNYNEFPYQKYFYDSERALRNFYSLIFENSKGYDNNLEDSLDQTSEAFFVDFTWDVVDTYKSLKEDNRKYFFKNLNKYIYAVNAFYKNIDVEDEFSKKLVLKLIDENNRKLQFVQEEFFDVAPVLNLEKWNEKSNYPLIFRNKNAERIFFAVVDEISAIKEDGTIMNAKASAMFKDRDMLNNVFVSGLKVPKYVKFLNAKYPDSIRSDSRLSDHKSYIEDVKFAYQKITRINSNKSEQIPE